MAEALAGTSNLPLGDLDPEVLGAWSAFDLLGGYGLLQGSKMPAQAIEITCASVESQQVGFGGCHVVEFRSSPGMGTFVRRDP